MELNIFRHALNTDFRLDFPNMSKAENEYFTEAFAHYHNVMDQYNGQSVKNLLWLNEHFMKKWNKHGDPKKLLEEVMEHVISESQNINININNTNPKD